MFHNEKKTHDKEIDLRMIPKPHHMGHKARHNIVSIKYDSEEMMNSYGELWPYHLERIAAEPPEMKILFALLMGFKVAINSNILDPMKEKYQEEPAYRFSNPALNDETLQLIAMKLNIEKEDVLTILNFAPEGVVSIILAVAKK